MRTSPLANLERLLKLLREETQGIIPKLLGAEIVASLVGAVDRSGRLAEIYRRFGFKIGAGTSLHGIPHLTGTNTIFENLSIGERCSIERDVTLDALSKITLGDDVVIEPGVMILTSSHELGPREHRAGPLTLGPVTIGDRAVIGARALLLPGVTIGSDAVVAPGALVNKDVRSRTRVGGNPAVVLEDWNETPHVDP